MEDYSKFDPADEAFMFFLHNVIFGDYADSYIVGWENCCETLGRNKRNPFMKTKYPLEHKGYNHGWEDAVILLTEFDKHWRGTKRI